MIRLITASSSIKLGKEKDAKQEEINQILATFKHEADKNYSEKKSCKDRLFAFLNESSLMEDSNLNSLSDSVTFSTIHQGYHFNFLVLIFNFIFIIIFIFFYFIFIFYFLFFILNYFYSFINQKNFFF